jgi:alpha-amylase/alpha-mannosidase (GH57 family)
MMQRYLCVHGHFYQPPRENPWLEAVEIQDGAYPYHDWNERITAECYATNASSRFLDDKNRIRSIVSNYANISFDIGPTLLSWLEKNAPETYRSILEADRVSASAHAGHGPAVAQTYNHSIMPLANSRDKLTQAIWGVRDFQYRFKRKPEGVWLPETAVDLESLEVLASLGIKFTILAPHQARRIRRSGSHHWHDVSGGRIDPSMPYACNLPSGRKITVFFYDSAVSHAVAFEGLLASGEGFAHRLLTGFSQHRNWPQLMHIATDGESYGHHHRFGDMALAYALHHIRERGYAKITNYGEYLEKHPAWHDVEIFERTSWSCAHGVERWRSDCGCNSGAHPGWRQQWRAPLFGALNWLRDQLAPGYEQKGAQYFKDPWSARDDYIEVILDRTEEVLEDFLGRHARGPLGPGERLAAVKLLELQRHAMLMYTSCGWFFDDISGIETVQILQYAGRAIQLAEEALGGSFEEGFVQRLREAKSNLFERGDGASIYEKHVRPVNLQKVCAHYAVSSLFEDYPEKTHIYCYQVERLDYRRAPAGRAELFTGKCRVKSEITWDSETFDFSVLHLGNHDFGCGVRKSAGEGPYEAMTAELHEAFESGAFADLVRLMDIHFVAHSFTLGDLFKDEQRRVLETLLKGTMEDFEVSYRRLYEENRILMNFLEENGIPIPKAFYTAAEFILNLDLGRELEEGFDTDRIEGMLREFKKWNASMDEVSMEFTLRRSLEREMTGLLEREEAGLPENPPDTSSLDNVARMIDVAGMLPFETNLWLVQNIYYRMAKHIYPAFAMRASASKEAAGWVEMFRTIGAKLNFNLEAVLPRE